MPAPNNLLRLAPLLIVVKSGWELSRMIRDKHKEQVLFDTEKSYLMGALRVAYGEGIISMTSYDRWRERLIRACKNKDSQYRINESH